MILTSFSLYIAAVYDDNVYKVSIELVELELTTFSKILFTCGRVNMEIEYTAGS